jgi:hypothetical protein
MNGSDIVPCIDPEQAALYILKGLKRQEPVALSLSIQS